jgi:hopanoid biosynthesis associated protein HpnK
MVSAEAAADAVARARRLPSLRVGLHLVLVDGWPVLPPKLIPALVDERGRFRDDMVRSGLRIFLDPAARAQLGAEIEAQFRAFAATGLTLDHVNSHKHFHLHPSISAALIQVGERYGLRAVRVPQENHRVLASLEPSTPPGGFPLAPWAALLRHRLRRRGLFSAEHLFGIAWSGAMTLPRLVGLIERLPAGRSELYLHPATSADFAGAAPGYRYVDELAALTAPETRAAVRRAGVQLATFSELVAQ